MAKITASRLGRVSGLKPSTYGVASAGGFSSLPVGGQAPPSVTSTTPVPDAPASPTPRPPDPSFEATRGALESKRDQLLSGLGAQRTTTLLDYGYNEGAGGALVFDPNNPYSRAAQLKRRYDQSRRGAVHSYAARGQLYSGALQNARDELNFQQGASEDTLLKQLGAFLAGNTAQTAGARTDYELGTAQARGQSVQNAASNPLYQPGLSSAQDKNAVSAPTPAAASVPGANTTSTKPASVTQRDTVVKASKEHGGKPWRYYRGQSGKLIPIGPA